jgi:hypothetical protein
MDQQNQQNQQFVYNTNIPNIPNIPINTTFKEKNLNAYENSNIKTQFSFCSYGNRFNMQSKPIN